MADDTTARQTQTTLMHKTAQIFASQKVGFNSSIDIKDDHMTEANTTMQQQPLLVEDESCITPGVKIVPETAVSKEQTEMDRSEMVDRDDIKVNFPLLKLNPEMSKTAQQFDGQQTGVFGKISHIDEEGHLDFTLNAKQKIKEQS